MIQTMMHLLTDISWGASLIAYVDERTDDSFVTKFQKDQCCE